MESGTEDLHPHSPSVEPPADQPPVQQDSIEEGGSHVEEKLFEAEGKISSSQFHQSSVEERGSHVEEELSEEKGSESETDEEESSEENKTQNRNGCTDSSDSERGSSPEISWKRKLKSKVITYDRTEASPDERSVTSERKKQKGLDSGHSSNSDETRDARPRRSQRRHPGRSKRPRSRSLGDQPPPLRKRLVTSLRSMSEAIYENILTAYNQQDCSPLLWAQLAQLRGPLCATVQTLYAMANQAAYVFPAEGWLVPGPWGPARDGGEGPSSEDGPPLP